MGLTGMRERARLLGGECLIESAPGAGTTVKATLPLDTTKEKTGIHEGHKVHEG